MSTLSKIGIAVLVVVIIIAGGAFLYLRNVSASTNLASLNTNDATAYRYTQIAKYYAGVDSSESSTAIFSIGSGFPLSGSNLENASPADEMAFRYQALANYYANHPGSAK